MIIAAFVLSCVVLALLLTVFFIGAVRFYLRVMATPEPLALPEDVEVWVEDLDTNEYEGPDVEDEDNEDCDVWRPEWSLHWVTLEDWIDAGPDAHNGRTTDYPHLCEQADAHMRRTLALHDLEGLLRDDKDTAFIALTIAEALYHVAVNAAQTSLSEQPDGDVLLTVENPEVVRVLNAINAASQRIIWRAAAHEFPGDDVPEPYGATVGDDDMPPDPFESE